MYGGSERGVEAYAASLTLLPVPFAATMRIMVVMYLPFIIFIFSFLLIVFRCSVNRTHAVEKGYSIGIFFQDAILRCVNTSYGKPK